MSDNETRTQLKELTKVLENVKFMYLLGHDNPDPDCLASLIALRQLLKQKFKIRSRIIYGGEIGRAENRAMVDRLHIPLSRLDQVRIRKGAYFALVDTQPGNANHSLPEEAETLLVFDHHPQKAMKKQIFRDIREGLGATSTMMLEYLRVTKCDIDWSLATALAYALVSETQDLGREAKQDDINAYLQVLPLARLRTLSMIRYPALPKDYYLTLNRALHTTYYYKNLVVTRLGAIRNPDMVHQMADLFLRFERRSYSLTVGWTSEWILFSLRSSNYKARCGRMLQKMLRGRGHAGGHDMVAGGRIRCVNSNEKQKKETVDLVVSRFVRLVGHDGGMELLIPLTDYDDPVDVEIQ